MRLAKQAKAEKALVLTFDDGPGSKLTPAILKVLESHNAQATFFLLGRNIPGREHIVRQMAEQGHEICSHGYDHLHYWKISPLSALRDIKRGWQAIDNVLGVRGKSYSFRPPKGKLNILCLLYLLLRRVSVVYWSVDLGDTWMVNPNPERIALLLKETGGVVSLAHDFDRVDEEINQIVLESLRLALTTARDMNVKVMTVSQLLHYR